MSPINPKTIEEALAHCLDNLEGGEFPIEEYLSHYPAYEKELNELLALIKPLNSLQQLSPRSRFVENASQKLISKLPDRNVTFQWRTRHIWQKLPQLPRRWFSMAHIVVALMFIMSVVIGGTAYAADSAEPGDLLYGLDLALEQVQLDLAPNVEAAAMVHLEHAAERLVEAQNRLVDGEVDEAIIALNLYGETIASLGQLIASTEGADQEALTEMLNAALEIHQEVLTNLITSEIVPAQAWDAIEKAIDASTPPIDIPDVPPVDVPPVDIPDVPPVDIPDDPPVDVPPDDIPDAPPVDVEPPVDIPDVPPVDVPPVDIPDDPPVDIPPVDILDVPPVDVPPVDIPDIPPVDVPPADIPDDPPVDVPTVDISDDPPVDVEPPADIPDDPPEDVEPPADIPDDPPVDVEPPADIPDDPPEDVEPPEDIPTPPPVPTEEPEIPEIPAPEPPAGRP